MQTNLDHSLEHFKKDIKHMISEEIILRYYGQKGSIVYTLREDRDLKESFTILKDKEQYGKILKPAKK